MEFLRTSLAETFRHLGVCVVFVVPLCDFIMFSVSCLSNEPQGALSPLSTGALCWSVCTPPPRDAHEAPASFANRPISPVAHRASWEAMFVSLSLPRDSNFNQDQENSEPRCALQPLIHFCCFLSMFVCRVLLSTLSDVHTAHSRKRVQSRVTLCGGL